MKRCISLYLLFCVIQLHATHKKLNLQKALEQKLVKAKAISLGGYQGYCMSLNLKNLSPDSLIVTVEPGRRLNSLEDKFQDIIIVKQELITLKRLEEKDVKVKGYCCQASNCAPGKNAAYDVNKLADSNLVTLARFLNSNCFSADVEQHAIWAISNNHSTAEISATNDTLLLPLRQLVSDIKGEQMPWFTVITGTYIYPNGQIITFPLVLRGKLRYSNDSDDYITMSVTDEKGNEVCIIRRQWVKPGQNLDYDLNVPVKGLAKGKYTVRLKTSLRELTAKEFEI